ncbi:SDR family oxidoreductase [Mesorhizobium silamurunense]|uniref:SDR family oxidoreductase n=1 Tax=Mesorhizobium silamurunense TaxID=499528 RepID=UPI001781FBE0|nr:SDR family oxidoreductase [Mesorhizobium silamurunense]
MSGKILVIGATGNVGRPLVRELVAAGEQVKAASRAATVISGAEAIRFDQADPSTYQDAFNGVDRVYVLVPSDRLDVADYLTPILQAAIERNVKVALQTALGVDADERTPYRQAELFLERSGTPFVIVRPTWFSDNFHLSWLPGIKAQGVIAVPAADGKSSFIDVRDIAASAASALRSNQFDGKAYNLTGPASLSYHEAAGILSTVAGKEVRYQPVDDQTFIGILTGVGMPADFASHLASLFYPVREGWTAVVADGVETLTGKPPRSLETYATDHAAKFKN